MAKSGLVVASTNGTDVGVLWGSSAATNVKLSSRQKLRLTAKFLSYTKFDYEIRLQLASF